MQGIPAGSCILYSTTHDRGSMIARAHRCIVIYRALADAISQMLNKVASTGASVPLFGGRP